MKDTQKLKDELFNAWEKYHSFSVDKSNFITTLNNDVKELLKIALIQEKLLPLQSGLFLNDTKESFDTSLREIGKENLLWLCEIFLDSNGTVSNKQEQHNFYLEFEKYCIKNSIDPKELMHEYKNRVSNLPFFPIYDQIFIRQLSETDKIDKKLKLTEGIHNKELQGFEKMWFHLGSLGKTLLGGILLLMLFGLVTSLAKIGTYLSR
jgi:hypothetical protein